MNLEKMMLNQRNQSEKTTYYMFHLGETSRIGESIEIEQRLMVARAWRRAGMGKYCLMGFLGAGGGGDESVLEPARGSDCTLWMY
jgi:hypothetical protein